MYFLTKREYVSKHIEFRIKKMNDNCCNEVELCMCKEIINSDNEYILDKESFILLNENKGG